MINDFLFDFIKTYQEEDMFLYLHLMDTHAPYFPDEEFLKDFYNSMAQRGLDVPTDPVTLLDELKFTQRPSYSPEDHLSEEVLLDLYRGAAQTADKYLQRFMDFLSEEGRDNETTLIFTSDHGEHLNEHPDVRLFTHMHPMLLEVLRIPLIIHSPGLLPGRKTVTRPTQLADLMPTMLDLAGISYNPTRFDGLSLLLLMAGKEDEFFNKRPIVSQSSPYWSVFLEGIHCPDITRGYDIMVYNTTTDPREHTPIRGKSAQKQLERLVNSLGIIPQREIGGVEAIINDEETLEQLKQLGYIQ
jgi:arylsulfatase A-like enzyme